MRYLLFLLSIIYDSITTIRNFLFNIGILNSQIYNIPIICIGNLEVGGTGKTPHTEYLIKLLKNKYRLAILSRGYARKSSKLKYVEKTSNPSLVGDEPLQIKQKYPDCVVIVEKNRKKGVKHILENHPEIEVILLDDGYQHRWIKAGLNILISTYDTPYYRNHLMPFGELRENKREAKRAELIIFSRTPDNSKLIEKQRMIKKASLFIHQQVYFSHIDYVRWENINKEKKINIYDAQRITLVTGIANSKHLINYLKKEGHTINHMEFPDHYDYTINDIHNILTEHKRDNNTNKIILTTEKDATKLRVFKDEFNTENLYYICIEINFEEKEKFDKQILNYVARN